MSILLVGWSDKFLLEAAKILVAGGAPVSHITLVGGSSYKGLPGEYGPPLEAKGVVFLEEIAYYRPERILALPRDPDRPLSAGLIRELAPCENIYLAATDRLSFTPISVNFRRRLYYLLVQHWLGFLEDNGIRSIVFSSTPHMGWDLVLFHVAKRMGIRVSYFNRTLILERMLFQTELDSGEKVPESFMDGLDREALAAGAGESLLSDSRDDSPWAKYSRDMNARMKAGVRIEWKRLAWMFIHFNRPFVSSSFFYDLSVRKHRQLIPVYFRYLRGQKALHRLYHRHVETPDYSRKYVFFALHFQPERSTLPEGGVFEDQLLAAEILCAAIPDDWIVYVKEHPRQFSLRFQSRHGRSETFYRQLLAMKRVRLVDTREDSGKLAQHAALVATVTGSIGWESIQMGKACIAFGHPWYGPCHSCYLVRSAEDGRAAVAAILAKSKDQVELDRLRYLAWIRDRLVLTSSSHEMASKSKTPYATLAANLAEAIRAESAPMGASRPGAIP